MNIDFQDAEGITELIRAAASRNNRRVKQLIDAGANLDLQDNWGWTALSLASENRNYVIVKLLINAGADLFLKSINGDTAYSLGDSKIRELILKKVLMKILDDEIRKGKLLTFTASGKLPKEMYEEIGKFLFGRRKYSRH